MASEWSFVRNCAGMRAIVIASFLLVALGPVARAQTAGATINGTVTDQSGAVIPGATVIATNIGTGQTVNVKSDSSGLYTIVNLAPGEYNLKASMQGFATILRNNQTLLVDTTVTINFAMKVSTTSEQVEVTAAAPEIEASQSTVADVLETHQLTELPILDRNFAELAALEPGVEVTPASTTAGSTASLAIGNGVAYMTGWTIDGVPIYRTFDGGVYINYAQDWIQEFSVETQQYPAEYGGVGTGLVNAVERSGTNQFHGRVYGFFQNAALNATPPFFKPSTLQPTKPPYNQERPGGMLGGPIKKDKLFFFGGFEYYRQAASAIVTPVPAAFVGSLFSLPSDTTSPLALPFQNTSKLGTVKLDWQINKSNSLELAGNIERDLTTNSGAGGGIGVGPSGTNTGHDFTDFAIWTWTVSAKAVNSLKFYDAKASPLTACNYVAKVGSFPSSGVTPITPYGITSYGNPTGWLALLEYPGAPGDTGLEFGCQTDYGLNGTGELPGFFEGLTYVNGNHTFTMGGNILQEYFQSHNLFDHTNGTYTFSDTQTVPFNPDNSATFPLSYLLEFSSNINYTDWTQGGFTYGMFVQDSWKFKPSLTLNYGIRWDLDQTWSQFNHDLLENPKYASNPGVQDQKPLMPDRRTISPRFGFAFSPAKLPNTVFRGGVGVFYDATIGTAKDTWMANAGVPQLAYNFTANNPSLNPYCNANPACAVSVPAADQQALEAVMAYALDNYTIPNLAPPGGVVTIGGNTYPVPPILGASKPGSTYEIDPNIRDDATAQITVGVQHQFNNGLVISGDYVYIRGFDDIAVRNVNINENDIPELDYINPNFSGIQGWGNGGFFNSNQFQAKLIYRDHRKDQIQGSYTLAFANTDTTDQFSMHTSQVNQTDPFNYSVDDGPTANDQTNTLVLSGVANTKWGILVSPIFSYASALPYTATTSAGPGTVPGCPAYYAQCYPTGYTRDSLRGASTISLNARVSKEFGLGESRTGTVFFEGYNIPNHLNLGTNFVTSVSSAQFMKPSGVAATPGRQLQAGFRFDF